MQHSDFHVGTEFWTATGQWRCTDVGSRTIVAIKIHPFVYLEKGWGPEAPVERTLTYEKANAAGWFTGPPYKVEEVVFGEDVLPYCCRTAHEYRDRNKYAPQGANF